MKRSSKIVRLFVIIGTGFIISWCPIAIGLCVMTMCGPRCGDVPLKMLSPFTTLNANLNVIVYFIKENKFRKDAIAAFKCCKRRQVVPQSNTLAVTASSGVAGTTPTPVNM